MTNAIAKVKQDKRMERGKRDETTLAREGLSEMSFRKDLWGSPGGSIIKNPPANVKGMRSVPDSGRSHTPRSN